MPRIHTADGSIAVQEVDGTLYTSWRIGDPALWEWAKRDFREHFPHWSGARYDAQRRAWAVPLHQRHRLATWADAWFRDDAQCWEEERDTADSGQRQERTRSAEPPRSTLDEAYRILWLQPGAPLDVAQAAYKALIKAQHPDHGGDHETAVAINRAMELIRSRAGAA